ncbi:nickel-type superoxide dismutase maturation protease [Streptomyces sp. HNM0574]|nr:nickel-type superoxide dismutase maturation protease [Streptomyces sp. HNM0574]NLU67199.1 nickel-type superoxide dismutase maturation protease [Streptomyces sp. HNM0574]
MPESAHEQGRPEPDGGGLLKRIGLAEVYNPSMLPTLHPGDHLVVRYGGTVRPGDVVVMKHPFQHDLLIVKRAVERRGAGWWVVGDNPGVRNDSREFGAVPDELLVARAWLRVRPRPRGGQRSSVPSVAGWALGAVRPLVRVRLPLPLRSRLSRGRSSLSRRLRAR